MKILSKIIIILGLFIVIYHYHASANGDCITKHNDTCYCPCGSKPTPQDYTYKILSDCQNKCNKCRHTRIPQQPVIIIKHIPQEKSPNDQETNNGTESKNMALLKTITSQLLE